MTGELLFQVIEDAEGIGTILLSIALRNRQVARAGFAILGTTCYIDSALAHDILGQLFNAVYTAVWAWSWWNNGGGDGTKRRLRKLKQAFTPTRRTAPQLTMEST